MPYRRYDEVIINPNSGEVIETFKRHVASGQKLGDIYIAYPKNLPEVINVKRGSEVTINLNVTYQTPDDSQLTTINLDPIKGYGRGFVGSDGNSINPYMVYAPMGLITLRANRPVKITLVLRVPDGLSDASFSRDLLGGVGFDTIGLEVKTSLSVSFYTG